VRLGGALVGLLVISGLEVVALAAVVPLMQVLSGYGAQSAVVLRLQDLLGVPEPADVAAPLAGLVLGLYALKAVVTLAFRWWLLGLMAREQVGASGRLFAYYLRAPYALHLRRTTPDLLATMNDAVGQVYGLVVTGSMLAAAELFTIAAVVVTLLVVFPVPALAAFAYFACAAAAFQWWAKPRMLRVGEDVLVSSRGSFQTALEALGTIKEIHVRQAQGHFLRRYVAVRRIAAAALRRSAFLTELPKHLMELLFILGIGVMTAVVFTSETPSRALSIIAVFATAGFRVLPSVVRAIASINNVRAGRYSLDRVLDDLRADAALPRASTAAGGELAFEHEVRIEGVDFSYQGSTTPVLCAVDVTIPHGASVALVGGSGAGKSTLADIVLGLLAPNTGRVTVDGVDIRDNLPGWRRHLGMVPQLVWLLDGTVRDNVAFGVPRDEVDDEQVWSALRAAELEDTVRAMAGGLDAEAGERGVRVSGGQRQRLGIARALYRHPTLLVLDEATSALDNETERRVTDTIATLGDRMTVLVIAHRLSTVRHCDLIIFLKEGRVAASGTFDELRATDADFARLVELGALT
jgi:ABC-type multidrug transport system fused ATPase/permease subunit